jgi:hypothetical protein
VPAAAAASAAAGSSAAECVAHSSFDDGLDDADSDALPFVWDHDAPATAAALHARAPPPHQHQQQQQQQQHGMDGGRWGVLAAPAGWAGAAAGLGSGAAGAAEEHDVAAGAFVRLVQQAAASPAARLDRRHANAACVGATLAQSRTLAAQIGAALF